MRALVLYLWVFLGAGLGGALRHGINQAGAAVFGGGFPAATLFVNLIGCFAIGALMSLFAFRGEWADQHARLFLTTGVLGGFTTFSAFSLDTAVLLERGQGGRCRLCRGLGRGSVDGRSHGPLVRASGFSLMPGPASLTSVSR